MFKFLKRVWAYVTTAGRTKFDEKADPQIQLEQAITEAQDQHRRLKEQAANVIAQQKQTEMRLNRALEEQEKANANARQAVLMAEEATRNGNEEKAAQYTSAAESIADRLVQLDAEVEDLKAMALQTSEAADDAKRAVAQNGQVLQQRLSERQQLLSQLEQAKMQESMNTAMSSLSETVGEDAPTFDEVRGKIESRQAKAQGMAELDGESVQGRMREVEEAAQHTQARARLGEIRAQLGIGAEAAPAGDAAADSSTETSPPQAKPTGTTAEEPAEGSTGTTSTS